MQTSRQSQRGQNYRAELALGNMNHNHERMAHLIFEFNIGSFVNHLYHLIGAAIVRGLEQLGALSMHQIKRVNEDRELGRSQHS